MKIKLAIIFVFSSLITLAQDKEISQLNSVPNALSNYHKNFLNDIHSYLGLTQHNAWSHRSNVLNLGEVSFTLSHTASFISYNKLSEFDNLAYPNNAHFTGAIGSLFLNSRNPRFDFYLLDPESQNPVVNPGTGNPLRASMPLLNGKGLNFGNIPSFAPRINIGLGRGAELGFTILPYGNTLMYNDKASNLLSGDIMWGVNFREDLSYYIPSLKRKNVHLTVGWSYNFNQWNLRFDENFEKMGVNDPTVIINSTVNGIRQIMNNNGFDIFLGKTYSKRFELYAFGLMVNNRINVKSNGALNIRFPDITAQNPDREIIIDNLVNYSIQKSRYSAGAGMEYKYGKFSLGVKYAYHGSHLISTGISYNMNAEPILRKIKIDRRKQLEEELGF